MTGLVTHPSTAVLAVGLVLVSMLCLATGLVLDTVNRRSQELMRLLTDQVLMRDERKATASDRAAADTGAKVPRFVVEVVRHGAANTRRPNVLRAIFWPSSSDASPARSSHIGPVCVAMRCSAADHAGPVQTPGCMRLL